MKKILLSFSLLFVLSAHADIEYDANQTSKASPEEVHTSRACFQELLVLGCGDPGDDPKHFRSCLNNVYPSLTPSCQKIMSNLYGAK